MANPSQDGLHAYVKGCAPCLINIRCPGSIKGCLVFVQKYFYLICHGSQEVRQFIGTFDRRGMDGWRFTQLAQAKVDTFKCSFDGRKAHPAFPARDPDRRFNPGSFHRYAEEGWNAGMQGVTAAEENCQPRKDYQ